MQCSAVPALSLELTTMFVLLACFGFVAGWGLLAALFFVWRSSGVKQWALGCAPHRIRWAEGIHQTRAPIS